MQEDLQKIEELNSAMQDLKTRNQDLEQQVQ